MSRVARPARGALRIRCVLVQYGEGPRGEPAGRMLVVAADRRLQQKCSCIMRARRVEGIQEGQIEVFRRLRINYCSTVEIQWPAHLEQQDNTAQDAQKGRPVIRET